MSMPSDPALYDARLSDGRTAAAMPVKVRLGQGGLEILPPAERRAALVWPYGELRSNVPLAANARDVVLSLRPNGSQTLFVAHPDFSGGLLARAGGLSPLRQRLMGLRPGIAVVVMVIAIALSVRFLELRPAQTLARLLPQQTREAMGRTVVAQLTGHMRRCETAAGRSALDRLAQRLTAASSDNPAPIRVLMLDWGLVNAFATPGGQIILTRGLVQKAGSPDEVAGVLAHEIGHAIELHPEAGGFKLAPGAHASLELDIMSVEPGLVGAETFAAVHPANNRKLKGDLAKLSLRQERHRYVFFMSPLFPRTERHPRFELPGIEVWSLEV